MGGSVHDKLLVPLNFSTCTMQTYHIRIHGWTLALQTSSVLVLHKVLYNADISEFMGGRWGYKLLVSLNFTNCTRQTYQKSWVDIGVTNSSVLKLYKLYNADISDVGVTNV